MKLLLKILLAIALTPCCLIALWIMVVIVAGIIAVVCVDSLLGGYYSSKNITPEKADYVDPHHLV